MCAKFVLSASERTHATVPGGVADVAVAVGVLTKLYTPPSVLFDRSSCSKVCDEIVRIDCVCVVVLGVVEAFAKDDNVRG